MFLHEPYMYGTGTSLEDVSSIWLKDLQYILTVESVGSESTALATVMASELCTESS